MVVTIGPKHLRLLQGDITKVLAEAIVNAANPALAGGGGVDGAIHRAGGPKIMEQLAEIRTRIGDCAPGDAVITTAGSLPAKYVIHAVGPVYHEKAVDQEEVLASCYRKAMRLAAERGVRIITFPSISTGAYGYPVDKAAEIAVAAVGEALQEAGSPVVNAIFVLYDGATYEAYERALRKWSIESGAATG
ncbi:MAG: O-acetyl-ADP-ribose deacetylase [Bryobacteraceae bacterium]